MERIDTDIANEDDDDALMRRRLALRCLAEDIATSIETIPMPESWMEAERAVRAVRAVTTADRIIGRTSYDLEDEDDGDIDFRDLPPLDDGSYYFRIDNDQDEPGPDETDPYRLRLRACADHVFNAALEIAKPVTFLEAGRAGRFTLACDQMFTQLYSAPQPRKLPDVPFPENEDDTDDSEWVEEEGLFQWQINLERKLLRLGEDTRKSAEAKGHWEDGRPYIYDDPYANPPECVKRAREELLNGPIIVDYPPKAPKQAKRRERDERPKPEAPKPKAQRTGTSKPPDLTNLKDMAKRDSPPPPPQLQPLLDALKAWEAKNLKTKPHN